MKQRKGFTLIELLAVIIILAIIALIAVPQILGVIEKSRKGAAEVSALGYMDAVEKYMIMHDIDQSKYEYDLRNKTLNVEKETIITTGSESITIKALNTFIEVKGTKPTSGTVTIDNKEVTSATLVMNGYDVTCTGGSCSASGSSSSNSTTPTIVTPEPASTTTESENVTPEAACSKACADRSYGAYTATYQLNNDTCMCEIKTCSYNENVCQIKSTPNPDTVYVREFTTPCTNPVSVDIGSTSSPWPSCGAPNDGTGGALPKSY